MIYLRFYIYSKSAYPSLHLRFCSASLNGTCICGVLNKLTLLKPKKVSL